MSIFNKTATDTEAITGMVVCPFCKIRPVRHEVIERQEHTSEYKAKLHKTIIILTPRKTTKGLHCPKCFIQNGWVVIAKDQVRVFKEKKYVEKI